MTSFIRLPWLFSSVVAASLLCVACEQSSGRSPGPTGFSLQSRGGLYSVELAPEVTPIPVGDFHRWRLTVRAADGAPVRARGIRVDGGMKAHGHGLPTAPRVAPADGDGRYLIEGLKFTMTGRWTLSVLIDAAAGQDVAELEFDVAL